MKNKQFLLEGLDCPNCAAKIESKVKKIKGINNVKINFINKTLTIDINFNEIDNNNIDNNKNYKVKKERLEKKISEIKKIIKKVEPQVKVKEKDNLNYSEKKEYKKKLHNKENIKKKSEIIKLSVSTVLFIIALILTKSSELQIVLFIIAYLFSGYKILLNSFKNILRGNVFDENFLMSIATIGAIAIGQYPEAVGVMLFYNIGEFLQNIAIDNSKRSIKKLLDIRPDYANKIEGKNIFKISPYEVKKGDYILVKPGERIPLDGKVVNGKSLVDTSAITGEPKPINVEKGDNAISGFICVNGVLTIEVEKEFGESTVAKILDMVENAISKKAKTEKLITKFARYYTPIVVAFAVLLATVPVLIFAQPFSKWLYRALIFLVISCPCGLVVSIPLGYFAGIGALSKHGILVKGSNFIDILKKLEVIVFDKTGTLTEGVFEVNKIIPFNNYTKELILEYAAYAEYYSNHPIAISVKAKYNKQIDETKISDYEQIPGYGIKALIKGRKVIAGNRKLIKKYGIDDSEIRPIDTKNNPFTEVYVLIEGKLAGYIGISDKIRENAIHALNKLKNINIKKSVLLTGDNRNTAEYVGEKLKIDEVYSNLLPQNKVEILQKYKNKFITAFVGDGINDAPVLAESNVGIAMGGAGTDIAIESADVVIMDDDLDKIADAIVISKKANKIIIQNILFVFLIKILFLTLGAFGLTDMWGAVFADVGVTLLAILNSIRIFKKLK